MSVSQASETEKMQMKISTDKQSKNGDEQVEGMSVSDMPAEEFTDPAILVIREIAKISYTKKELLKLREAPLSRKKPDFIDVSEVSPSIWDPERWSGAAENGPRAAAEGSSEHRRRPGDPRERIRKENDGIVLSPQRRSFNSGCFVPVRGDAPRNNRSHSPLGAKTENPHMGIREIQTNTRRIGSGRILRVSVDFIDKSDGDNGDYSYRGQQQQQQRNNNNNDREDKFGDKFERRSFGRDYDTTNNNKETRRSSKYDRRRTNDREMEEPEWFSGGPVSQNDTIELRGFDDDKPGRKKLSPANNGKRNKEAKKKSDGNQKNEEVKEKEGAEGSASAPQAGDKDDRGGEKAEKPKKSESKDNNEKTEEEGKAAALVDDHSFNFDDILKCDTIPGLLTNGVAAEADNTKSRFSRWFKQESPEKQESRRSSLHDDHHLIKNLLKEIGETSVTIPGDSDAYFAPISPAANTGGVIGGKREFPSQPVNIIEMLQRGKQPNADPLKQSFQGKILSLDELEAKIRQNVEVSAGINQKHQQQKPDEDMAVAFKKLLEQAQTGNHPTSMTASLNKSQPMSLLEMLNHSQQQDEAARRSGGPAGGNSHHLGGTAANSNIGGGGSGIQHHQHVSNDLTMKLQQAQLQQQQKQQMEMLNKLINATTSVHPQQLRASPLHDLVMQQSRDLLNRPEAQAILQGLKRGEITTQHLYQQLANPALQPRHREMLLTILKVNGGGGGFGPSPRVLSPVPSHHLFQQQQQQQQLRVSPLPPNAMHQRIPSPRELQVHTQSILQRALIKKKLEEQQENYRKKQEMMRGQSPNNVGNAAPVKSVTSPTPLAFTPTSVLRKMTADKDEGKENKGIEGKVPPGRPLTGMRSQAAQPQVQQWNPNTQYMSNKHPGRPIVKANNNFPGGMGDQFFGQQPQQQQQQPNQQMQQQRAQQQQLAFQQQQQQRKVMGSQFSAGQGVPQSQYNPQQYSTNQQFTQQQLRAQHQHRPANQQPVAQQQQQQQQQQSQSQPQMNFQQQQSGQQQQHMAGGNWQQFFNNSHQGSRNSKTGLELDGNRLSSNATASTAATVNQLARWFSPDLLERARGGELPSTAGLSQHVLSLEEIERQTAPPVHN